MDVDGCSILSVTSRFALPRWLRMRIGIVHGQPFGRGGAVESLIGGNQRDGAGDSRLMEAVDFKSHGKLHSIVGAKRVLNPQPHGVVQQGGRHLGDGIPSGEVLAEAVEN